MAQAEGRRVGGRYHLVEQIGRGGMGVVWRAHDELLDREVAVKEVRFDSAMGAELNDLNRRTMREARAAGRLTHPNVVVVHDVIEEDGRPWIVMQFVPSRSLGQVLREDGPLSPERTAEIGLQILDALRAAHRQGVLHRDVKPENVLLAEDGRVVLTDFGIARIEADSTMTRTGLVGTPAFIPPERLRGYPAQRESDLWSLGATLYAAVEGKAPHDRGMAMATMHAILNDEPTPPKRAGRLGPVLIRLLAKEPADRPGYDEVTRLLRQASRPAAKPPAAAADSTVRIDKVDPSAAKPSAAPAGKAAGAGHAAGGGVIGASASRGRPYASAPAVKRSQAGEDDRSAATRKHTGAKPSAPAEAAGTPAAAPETPPKGATETTTTGGEAPGKSAPDPDAGASPAKSTDGGASAEPDETTSPLPELDADGSPVREAETGKASEDTAPSREASEVPPAADPASPPSGDPDPGDARKDPKVDRAAAADKPHAPGEADGAAKPGPADPAPKTARPVIPETGAQAAPALAVPKRPSATTRSDRRGTPERRKPAGATARAATGAASAASPLAGLRPAPVPSKATVPTQRRGTWPGNARPNGAQPIPVLKLTLVLLPVLVIIAVVAGYLGMRDAERSSGTVDPDSASSMTPPNGKPKKSPGAEASQPAAAAVTASPDQRPGSTDGPTPSPSASQPADPPKGWYRYTDKTGFSVALPNGWKVSERRATQVWFRGPGTPGALLIDQTNSPKKNAEKDWRRQEPYQKGNFPGYRRVKIVSVDYWKDAADWEFTYNGRSGRMHVINRGFVTDKRHGYAIYWTTPDSRWKKDYHYFQTFTATFRPAK